MRVLLLGGTGALGSNLRRLLADAGHEVVVTTRSEHVSKDKSMFFVRGDAKEMDFLMHLLDERWDAVVDFMVWSTAEFSERRESFLGSTSQYVFVSSYRVYADSPVITEDSPRLLDVIDDLEYLATDEYALSKARCEDLLFSSGVRNWTIVRPAITYDRSGRFQLGVLEAAEWLPRALKGIPVPFPQEMLEKQATMSYGADVAKMIELLIGSPIALGEAFTVSTAEHRAWADVAGIYSRLLPLCIWPCSVEVFGRMRSNVYQIRYDRMFDRVIDNSKILEATGLRQEDLATMDEGLTGQLSAYLGSDPAQSIACGLCGKMDRITGGFPSLGIAGEAGPAGLCKYFIRRLGI